MVIMIIFLILSIVLVIGTAIYLNNKKKKVNRNIKQNPNQETKEKSSKKAAGTLAAVSQTPQRFKGRKSLW